MRNSSSKLNPTSLRKKNQQKKTKQKQETAPAAWQGSARMVTWSSSALVKAMELITDEH